MELMIQLVARQGTADPVTTELVRLERGELSMDTFGLALVEAKTLLGRLRLQRGGSASSESGTRQVGAAGDARLAAFGNALGLARVVWRHP